MEDHKAYAKAYMGSELDGYEGKWVVFVDGKMVWAGEHPAKAIEDIRKERGRGVVPFLAKVPKKSLMVLPQIGLV